MGLMGQILGAGKIIGQVGEVAEVFTGNQADREAAEARQTLAALEQYGREFAQAPVGRFDRFMNALNRLPRPLLVIGTLALFLFAMFAPEGFALRMRGLALVPDPMWWLLGAIVSFYFGARELHYSRNQATATLPRITAVAATETAGKIETLGITGTSAQPQSKSSGPNDNAALAEWRLLQAS